MADPQYAQATAEADGWRSLGPDNKSGRIKCLALDPEDDQRLYAGSANGGVWRTADGGATWEPTMEREASLAIGALGIAPHAPKVLYAATGEGVSCFRAAFAGAGVYKTTDGGDHWVLTAPVASRRCTRVMVNPSCSEVVYVAGDAGLHQSKDGGRSWITVMQEGYVSDALMDPEAPGTIYAAVWHRGVYKTVDGGANWHLLTGGLPTGGAADWIKLAMGGTNSDGVRPIMAKMGHNSGLLLRSGDGGMTWQALPGRRQPCRYSGWTSLVAVSPLDGNLVFAGAVKLERSTDGGMTFKSIRIAHQDQQALVFSEQTPGLCYLANDGGIYRSMDYGETGILRPINQGLVTTQFYSLGVSQTSPLVIGGATQDRGILVRGASGQWSSTFATEGGFFIADPNESGVLYMRPDRNHLHRRVGDGDWTPLFLDEDLQFVVPSVGHMAVQFGNSRRLLCSHGEKLFLSTNQGKTWCLVLEFAAGGFTRVAFSRSHPQVCYATTDKGQVWRSERGGNGGSWQVPHQLDDGPPWAPISALAVDWDDPGLLYVAGGCDSTHVYGSGDGGVTWANADGIAAGQRLPASPISALALDRGNPKGLYAATEAGLFRSQDSGRVWEPFDDGLPRIAVTDLALHLETHCLYVSTFGRGIFVRHL